MQICVLSFLALSENVKDCNGVEAMNEFGRLKELFHKVVAAKPSFIEAWELYARVVLLEQNTADLKKLSNQATILQKAVRALMTDASWHLEEKKRERLCELACRLGEMGLRYASLNRHLFRFHIFLFSDLEGATNIVGAPTRLALKSFLVKLRTAQQDINEQILFDTEKKVSEVIESIESRMRN